MTATVVLADDHPPTRAGVRAALEAGGFDVLAEVANGPAAVEAVLAHAPDVALLDVDMRGGGGIDAAAELRRVAPGTAVVMLTVSDRDEDLFAALQAGALGYLLKDTDPTRLPHALLGVLAGEAALPRALVARLIGAYRTRHERRTLPLVRNRAVELTAREWEVLDLLGEELTTKQIAERLHVSPVTVRRHVSALLDKLAVGSRREAVELLRTAR